ncbi:alpha/beta fold hydrolase [Haladaptatus sp. CMAA 1911]|uniref:alpha/beta fold hydrolase n=1 Tax=Haladaptatus sp. CMAA 1911 TaxID=3368987 RepID=UPI003753FDA9
MDPIDTRSHGLRILAPDRPGVGESDPILGRGLLDWPTDVVQLADELDVDEFAVIGVSGGGPYALACAYTIPERLTAVTIVSGVAPLDTPDAIGEISLIEQLPIRTSRRSPRISRCFLGDVAEEYRVCGEPWGFDVVDIALDIDVWYGTRDWSLSAYHATIIASQLPNATLHTLPNTSHLGSVANHNNEILASLTRSMRSESLT